MVFAKQLRDRVRSGEIRCTVRFWHAPRVRVGGRYPLAPGHVEVTDLREIGPDALTDDLARRSGFDSLADLLAIARHGSGDRIFLVEFVYAA